MYHSLLIMSHKKWYIYLILKVYGKVQFINGTIENWQYHDIKNSIDFVEKNRVFYLQKAKFLKMLSLVQRSQTIMLKNVVYSVLCENTFCFVVSVLSEYFSVLLNKMNISVLHWLHATSVVEWCKSELWPVDRIVARIFE